MNESPIGIFDAGFGGLTVMRSVISHLPHESVIYLADSARCPYGLRSEEDLRNIVLQICAWFESCGAKLIVIACNTATSCALEVARAASNVPVLGVIEPGARVAVDTTRNGRIGVVGTERTVETGVFPATIAEINTECKVFSHAAQRFAGLVENDLIAQGALLENGVYVPLSSAAIEEIFEEEAQRSLVPLRDAGVDTLVLGCTHFPVIAASIQRYMGDDVTVVSPSDGVARDVEHVLGESDLACNPACVPSYEFFTTGDDIPAFNRLATAILGREVANAQRLVL